MNLGASLLLAFAGEPRAGRLCGPRDGEKVAQGSGEAVTPTVPWALMAR